MQRSSWSFSGRMVAFSPSTDGGRGNASIMVSSESNPDSKGSVEMFSEKETFFFMRSI